MTCLGNKLARSFPFSPQKTLLSIFATSHKQIETGQRRECINNVQELVLASY